MAAYNISDDKMLMFFLSELEVRAKWLRLRKLPPSMPEGAVGPELPGDDLKFLDEIESEIEKLKSPAAPAAKPRLNRDAAWTRAYRVERLMSLLEPTDTLIPEIRRRVDQAKRDEVAAEPRLSALLDAVTKEAYDSGNPARVKPAEVPALHNFLLEILEETHGSNQRKYYLQPILKEATRRIVLIGFVAFLIFLFPYLYLYYKRLTGGVVTVESWSGLALYSALTAGLFGAFFSRLMFLQSNGTRLSTESLRSAREFYSIALRGCVGMCGALIVYFFLQSGLVSGSLFPKFGLLGLSEGFVPLYDAKTGEAPPPALGSILPRQDLALLVIWCFLAGFSERLVPNILSSTEATLGDAARGQKK